MVLPVSLTIELNVYEESLTIDSLKVTSEKLSDYKNSNSIIPPDGRGILLIYYKVKYEG